uniref:Membrin n=1 Tax=Wollemia nobilis TaxID=56998 RepID=A0A0C9S4X6_9CONI
MAGGTGTLSEVYQQARHLLLSVRDGLERLERLESHSSLSSPRASARSHDDNAPDLAHSLKRDLSQLQTYSVEMDRLWRSQMPKSHRDLWKRKLEQVAEEVDSLKLALDKYLSRRHRRQMEAKERAELLQRVNGDSARVLQIFDEEAQAMQSVRNSSSVLEEAYATGVAVLAKYSEQRDRLKQAQRKALDILNTVGLSNSVLKIIERRHRLDKWISYIGMFLTVVIIIVVWRWTH